MADQKRTERASKGFGNKGKRSEDNKRTPGKGGGKFGFRKRSEGDRTGSKQEGRDEANRKDRTGYRKGGKDAKGADFKKSDRKGGFSKRGANDERGQKRSEDKREDRKDRKPFGGKRNGVDENRNRDSRKGGKAFGGKRDGGKKKRFDEQRRREVHKNQAEKLARALDAIDAEGAAIAAGELPRSKAARMKETKAGYGARSELAKKRPFDKKPAGKKGERKKDAAEDFVVATGAPCCDCFRDCGGCKNVREDYQSQLDRKDAVIAELFADLVEPLRIQPILGMDYPFFYRNKVITPFAPGKKGVPQQRDILTGMYAPHSHRIINTDSCVIDNDQAKKVIRAVRKLMKKYDIAPYNEDTGEGFMRHAVIRVGHSSGEVLVTLVTNGKDFPSSKAFCRELLKLCPFVTTVVQNVNERQTNVIMGQMEQTLRGPGFILDELCGLGFRISSQSFYQTNSEQTEVLYDVAIQMAGLTGTEHVVDAYCGTGTIGLVAAANGAAHVIGVDSVSSAVHDARENARHNELDNVEFVHQDASRFMRELAATDQQVDVLFMDPPRAGSTPTFLESAAEAAPERIVYISCCPQTQVRDVAILMDAGYTVETVQPVDMFPHTDHVENIVLLTKE